MGFVFLLLLLLLLYRIQSVLRFLMEGGHIAMDGDMSASQAWMPVCATPWSEKSKNAAGTPGLVSRIRPFGYFSAFEK